MHRLVMGVEDPKIQVDHINHETLDNRRSQLRLCTQRQNSFNTRKHSNNTSGFKGVTQRKDSGKWGAYIRINGRKKTLGAYATPELAARAYAEAAATHHGEFARL